MSTLRRKEPSTFPGLQTRNRTSKPSEILDAKYARDTSARSIIFSGHKIFLETLVCYKDWAEREFLKKIFLDWWIGHDGLTSWPPCFLNIRPLDLFLRCERKRYDLLNQSPRHYLFTAPNNRCNYNRYASKHMASN